MKSPEALLPQDFVLLANARAEKGFDLILEVAALLPKIAFVCIDSQSRSGEPIDAARLRGLPNVHVMPRTDDMHFLYSRAKVVAVPSYRFVESFSRVCIEAHRHGKPVIGSNVGNVPYLLEKSGIVLPAKASEWARELDRLFTDTAYYAAARAAAFANSAAYTYADQQKAVLNVLRQAEAPMLVGVGSGIGNMIHVSPMIRRLAEHLGRPVDLLIAEDHPGSLFLLHNPAYVNAAFSLRPYVFARRYDTVFLTHSFGAARLPLKAGRVLRSRDWDVFHPDHQYHEAAFNLEAAKQLLGVGYDPEDAQKCYVGELTYDWPAGNLVGLHGGSKDGFWLSKRWPHYPALTAWLKERGYRVASFGTSEEYVDNTEDMTGGTIQEMAERMRACSYFVSNDSGVMHLANALGIPLIGIFGPTNARTRGPLRRTSRSVSLVKDCAPCECRNASLFLAGRCGCIGELPMEAVADAFVKLERDCMAPVERRRRHSRSAEIAAA